ncbi:MAG: hypothetical protein P1P74_12660, partial [Desulfuromonadales bacterium]|nr:hypothetical protein [Desulfuromonadales bacterium]
GSYLAHFPLALFQYSFQTFWVLTYASFAIGNLMISAGLFHTVSGCVKMSQIRRFKNVGSK